MLDQAHRSSGGYVGGARPGGGDADLERVAPALGVLRGDGGDGVERGELLVCALELRESVGIREQVAGVGQVGVLEVGEELRGGGLTD